MRLTSYKRIFYNEQLKTCKVINNPKDILYHVQELLRVKVWQNIKKYNSYDVEIGLEAARGFPPSSPNETTAILHQDSVKIHNKSSINTSTRTVCIIVQPEAFLII